MKSPAARTIAFILRYRIAALTGLAAITIALGSFLKSIEINNDPTKTVPPDLRERMDYEKIKSMFPAPRTILFIARFEPMDLVTKVDSLIAWAERFDAVEGIDEVVHIGSVQVPIQGGFLGMTSDYLVSRKRKLDEDELRERIRTNRQFVRTLVSDDESVFGMVLMVDPESNEAEAAGAVEALKEQINRSAPATLYSTGGPLYAYFIDRAMRHDFGILLPVCLVVVFLMLFWILRSVSHALAALAVTFVALVWTFGIFGLAGSVFSIASAIIPVIMFPIGVAYSIHVIKTYSRIRQERGVRPEQALEEAYAEVLKPVFLSAITTVFGFYSLSFSDIGWTRTFGIYTSLGVAIIFLLTAVLLPPLVSFGQERRKGPLKEAQLLGPGSPFWKQYRAVVLGSPAWLVVLIAAILAGAIGLARLRVESNAIALFPRKSDIVASDNLVGTYFGGTRFFSVAVTNRRAGLRSAAQWDTVSQIVQYAGSKNEIGNVASLLPLVQRVSEMMTNQALSDAAVSLIVEGRGIFSKSFKQYIDRWVSQDRMTTKIDVTCRNDPGISYTALGRSIEEYVEKNCPGWEALAAGPMILNDGMAAVIINTQITSLLTTLVTVFVVLCVVFRSVPIGTIAVLPIMLAALTVNALMGLTGVPLNMITVVIVNTCIGIGIDYAVHFISGYQQALRESATGALMAAATRKGAVILFNTYVVGLGFLVLAGSTFPPIRHFGVFVFVSMVATSSFALLFLPVLLRVYEARRRAGR